MTKSIDGTLEFRYLPEYLTASDRPIATTLPLTDEPIRTFGGSLPAYFAGLLPEGHRLSVLRRAVKTRSTLMRCRVCNRRPARP
ncbi:HipA N-terminal domain-containing protein [Nocardia rhamnosiphila]|uniref:HipA N-terminal domain-containing protein n=1 Tax=Nocardia rhamnosiphila TaxID=426716 RepID=UPI0033CC3868